MSDEPTPPGGFPCPRCGRRTTVYSGMQVSATLRRRWRMCLGCDFKFRTSERPVLAPNTAHFATNSDDPPDPG